MIDCNKDSYESWLNFIRNTGEQRGSLEKWFDYRDKELGRNGPYFDDLLEGLSYELTQTGKDVYANLLNGIKSIFD